MFKRGTNLIPAEIVKHLFKRFDENLSNAVLKANPGAAEGDEDILLHPIKKHSVIPVAIHSPPIRSAQSLKRLPPESVSHLQKVKG